VVEQPVLVSNLNQGTLHNTNQYNASNDYASTGYNGVETKE
jgi:hypothetical protein